MSRRRYSMLELVAAMALLAMMTTAVVGAVAAAKQARIRTTQEARAILVLENTVVRLGTKKTWSEAAVQAVLAAEFAAVTMPRREGVRAVAERQSGRLSLAVIDGKGHRLAAVFLPSGETP